MKNRSHPLLRQLLIGLGAAWVGAAAAMGAGLSDFPLLKAIPEDAGIVVAARDHDGLDFVSKQYDRVWEALERARLDREFKRMLKKAMGPAGTPEDFEDAWLQISDLLAGVDWGTLAEQEMALGVKTSFPPELVLLARPPADRVAANYQGLVGLAEKLADMAPELELKRSEAEGVQMCQLVMANMPMSGLQLARRNDVLLIGLGASLPARSMQMLEGGEGAAIVDSARFQQAFKPLPAPRDGLAFVDVAQIMTQVRTMVNQFVGPMVQADPNNAQLKLPGRLLDMVDLFDHVATVSGTDGKQRQSEGRLVLRDGAKSKPLYKAMFGNPPLKEPLKYIPANAGDVWVTNGVDLLKLYELLVGFMRDSGAEGAMAVQMLDMQLQAIDLDIERDMLGWLAGPIAYYTVPGPTQFSPGQWAVMLKVNDPNRAAQSVDRAMAAIEGPVSEQDGRVATMSVAGKHRFRVIQVPMLAMFSMQPAIGVTDEWLMIASGTQTVEAALDAAAGGKNFAGNKRFKEEGLPVSGDVVTVSFTDTSKLGESMSQMLQMAPMLGFMSPEIGQNPTISALLQIAGRLGPVAQELNFFRSDCSVATFDGQVMTYKTVNNYREPPAKPSTPTITTDANAPVTTD